MRYANQTNGRPRFLLRAVFLCGSLLGLASFASITTARFHASLARASSPQTSATPQDESTSDSADTRVQFNRDIRPILIDTCFACHGPDSAAREADLRIDDRDAAIAAGVWVPGDPAGSQGIDRIFADDPDYVMPPADSHKEITESQKQLLYRWVEQGAEYEPHWAFIPPQQPSIPALGDQEAGAWIRNPIDAFVLEKLRAEGLTPAKEADRYTLARRAALDTTGLPPTPEMISSFVNDPHENAYERYVDRLLASERWGEHRGRYWLDAARYADTHGIHFDNYREMWSYRDWVINAFNKNMAFDQFTIESIAGDLLESPTRDQLVASGFNRCNITTNEGGIIDEEYLVLYTRDRTETVAQVWLGLTANCAVCHDHKFDPLTQREFYEMSAFFNNTVQGARDQNIKDTPPVVVVPRLQDRHRWDQLTEMLADVEQTRQTRRSEANNDFQSWLQTATTTDIAAYFPTSGLDFHAKLKDSKGSKGIVEIQGRSQTVVWTGSPEWRDGPQDGAAIQPQGALFESSKVGNFDRQQPFSLSVWVNPAANDSSGAICARMDDGKKYRGWDFWMQQRRFGMHLINTWPSNALKVISRDQVPADRWTHVTVTYDGSGKAAGVQVYFDGVRQSTNTENDSLSETTLTEVPFKIGQRDQGEVISAVALSDLRIYTEALSDGEAQTLAQLPTFRQWLEEPIEHLTDEQSERLYAWWLAAVDEPYQQIVERQGILKDEFEKLKREGTVAHVMQERETPASAFVLHRGEYDQRRDEVFPDTPEMLPPFPDAFAKNRLGLAKWLLLPEHPLTSRVTVNRFWQQIFGEGIVPSAGDFGLTGQLPSHPELLDWLAVDFRESGWDVKRFFKQILMSATYRQSSQVTPDKLAIDPDNRYLSRGPRFRMDAEMIRDYALAACGTLSATMGGPSVKPYQPPGVWEAVAMLESNTHDYVQDHGESLYRRSMYTFWKRSAPPASMETFNAPSREFCVVSRERTNTPLQALVTLNDPQFIEAARSLAEATILSMPTEARRWSSTLNRSSTQGDSSTPSDQKAAVDQTVNSIGMRLLCRPLADREKAVLVETLQEYLAYYHAHPDDAQQLIEVGESKADQSVEPEVLASYTMLINTMLNMDELLNK